VCDLRRASDRQSKSRKRANETEQEIVECRATDRQCKAKRRANETEQETVERRKRNKQRMVRKRATVNIAVVIEEFLAKVKMGPEYVNDAYQVPQGQP